MNRRDLHKSKQFDTEKSREKRRWQESDLRKKHRDKIINTKRLRDDFEENTEENLTIEKVEKFAIQIQQNHFDRLLLLQKLKKAFSSGGIYIDAFLKTNNALQCLVGLLSGNDAQLQLESAWCISNIAAGTHEHSMKVLRSAGSYLVTLLSSGNTLLQDQCAWAIGNIAGDGYEAREILMKQGVLQPLINLLKSPHYSVIQSAAFALSNLMRSQDFNISELLESDIISILLSHLDFYKDEVKIISEVAWVLTYLAARLDNHDVLVNPGCLERIVSLLVPLADETHHNSQIITPLLRCLGNICSGPDIYSLQACQNSNILIAIGKYLKSDHRYIRKESLWVLSNMTAGDVNISRSIAQAGLIPVIVNLLSSAYDIKHEAMYCICNLAYHGPEFCSQLLSLGTLGTFILTLKSAEADMIILALKFVEMMLRTIPEACHKFEEEGGTVFLEGLEYHDNKEICTQANQLLDIYFLQEKQENDIEVDEHISYPPWRIAAQQKFSGQ